MRKKWQKFKKFVHVARKICSRWIVAIRLSKYLTSTRMRSWRRITRSISADSPFQVRTQKNSTRYLSRNQNRSLRWANRYYLSIWIWPTWASRRMTLRISTLCLRHISHKSKMMLLIYLSKHRRARENLERPTSASFRKRIWVRIKEV